MFGHRLIWAAQHASLLANSVSEKLTKSNHMACATRREKRWNKFITEVIKPGIQMAGQMKNIGQNLNESILKLANMVKNEHKTNSQCFYILQN